MSDLPEPWNEESSRRILALVEERDKAVKRADERSVEAAENLIRAVKAERDRDDLLAALEELAREEWRDDGDPILDRARANARAAIAKARGK